MRIQGGTMNTDSSRTVIDHHAVSAAGQLLISAIWFEHRVRRFSTRLSTLPSRRASVVSLVSSSASHQSDRGLLVPDGRDDPPTSHQEKGTTQ